MRMGRDEMKIIKNIDGKNWQVAIDTTGCMDICAELCEWDGDCGVDNQLIGNVPCFHPLLTLVEYSHSYLIDHDQRGHN